MALNTKQHCSNEQFCDEQNWDALNSEWFVEAPEDCLELLSELRSLGDSAILEWPEGGKIRVSPLNNFQMSIQRQNDWFETHGGLQLEDGTVLNMQQLMGLLNQSSSRFIPLGEGHFLAIAPTALDNSVQSPSIG